MHCAVVQLQLLGITKVPGASSKEVLCREDFTMKSVGVRKGAKRDLSAFTNFPIMMLNQVMTVEEQK
jgi:hypothetical protein